MEENSKNNHLATESIGKLLIKMIIPSVIAQIVNLLYNIVDRMFITKIPNVGTLALTGVGVTFPIIILISAFACLIGMGGAPRAAIKMGKNDYEEAEHILSNCFISLIMISAILTLFFLIFNSKLLIMFGASEQTLPYARQYANIYVIGTIFVQITLGLNPFINAQGFVNTAMKTVLIGAGLNIVLDFILIRIFNLGVMGAALATVSSQAISAIWVLRFLTKSKATKIKIRKKYFKLKKSIMFPIIALGISPFIMQSTESLLNIAFNSSLKRYGGDIAVGSMTIIATIMQCVSLIATGIGQGAQPIISFNYGAGHMDRVKKTYKLTIIISVIFTSIMWVLCVFNPQLFVGIFAKGDENMMGYASLSLQVYIFSVFIIGLQFACQQTFVALGQAKVSLFLALLRKIILLIPLIYILPAIIPNGITISLNSDVSLDSKVFAIFLAEPISDFISAVTTGILFIITIKKLNKNFEKNISEKTT
ncbi:MATE family efflux transporter [[Clostridium] colinum]|uniref:MATE family efflux transporter n=1 Tax=[Clostridium] colinum TaxID=36835 RepID=UPI002FE6F40D